MCTSLSPQTLYERLSSLSPREREREREKVFSREPCARYGMALSPIYVLMHNVILSKINDITFIHPMRQLYGRSSLMPIPQERRK